MQTVIENKALVSASTTDRATRELIEIVKNKRNMSVASKAARDINTTSYFAQGNQNWSERFKTLVSDLEAKGYMKEETKETKALLRELLFVGFGHEDLLSKLEWARKRARSLAVASAHLDDEAYFKAFDEFEARESGLLDFARDLGLRGVLA